ncbi:hypothetical protein GQ44DRAFT_744272 [Phaeosphaeriaceae sp. PMI808]|nr:hypothetical protein GQ44DRAFT_744272 [Phaeosphaeriaceae sp. PMI808]
MLQISLLIFLLSSQAIALNFAWEYEQLTESEALTNPSFNFGTSKAGRQKQCKTIPGDDDWPSTEDWAFFNETLGGVLLKPKPLASPCYTGPTYNAQICAQLQQTWTNMNLQSRQRPHKHHVPMVLRNILPPNFVPKLHLHPRRLAHLPINFARNNNIRLVIKNTGHDFNGKNIGAHALSLWTHHLKGIVYHANYTTRSYAGRAVAYGAGTQAFIVAGGGTVGIAGGFLMGGGNSGFAGYYGLAADQVVGMSVVGADGKVVECGEREGGEGGDEGRVFGVVTSVVVRAFPSTPMAAGNIRFSTSPRTNTSISTETFWAGVRIYWDYAIAICDAGGLGYSFIYPEESPQGLTFTVRISFPNKSTAEYHNITRPLLQRLNDLGIHQFTVSFYSAS